MEAMHIEPGPSTTSSWQQCRISLRSAVLAAVLAGCILQFLFALHVVYQLNMVQQYAITSVVWAAALIGIQLGRKSTTQPQVQAQKWVVLLMILIGIGLHPLCLSTIKQVNHHLFMLRSNYLLGFTLICCLLPIVAALTATLAYHHQWHEPAASKPWNISSCVAIFAMILFYGYHHLQVNHYLPLPWVLPTLTTATLVCLMSFINREALRAMQWFELVITFIFVLMFNINSSQL